MPNSTDCNPLNRAQARLATPCCSPIGNLRHIEDEIKETEMNAGVKRFCKSCTNWLDLSS